MDADYGQFVVTWTSASIACLKMAIADRVNGKTLRAKVVNDNDRGIEYEAVGIAFARYDGRPIDRISGKRDPGLVSNRETNARPRSGETKAPAWEPPEFINWCGRQRYIGIDSGATVNSCRGKMAEATNEKLRRTRAPVNLNSANGLAKLNLVTRGRVAIWDVEADYLAMPDSPELSSMGERCWDNDYSFLWIRRRRYPCYLLDLGGIIIIFYVDCLCPVWNAEMEESPYMFGSFEFYENAFRTLCGIYLNPVGLFRFGFDSMGTR